LNFYFLSLPFKIRIISGLKIYIFYFILALSVLSCNASYGEKYTIGNLEIFFTDDVSTKYVERLGVYFDENNLIQSQTHSVQLTSDPKMFILKMVLNSSFTELPEDQHNSLELLEADIQTKVFEGLPFRIDVCDINFNLIQQ
jgi:hypothetical protein